MPNAGDELHHFGWNACSSCLCPNAPHAHIKGLLALHGIWLSGKRIGKGLRGQLDNLRTGDDRALAPCLRRDIERMLTRYDLVSAQIAEVEADRRAALADERGTFPHANKVRRLATLGSVGETTATVLVAEVYHRTFETRRHVLVRPART
jgi:transposase